MTDPDETTGLTEAIDRARQADPAAFDLIYRALHPGLLRYLRVLVGEEAEDVASETWLQIARDLDSFRGDWDRFRGWAVTIARHRALDHCRWARRHPHLPVEQVPDRAVPLDTADAALESIGTGEAIALLTRLPREQAEAIILRVLLGLDAKSCGQVLGRRAGAVRTATHRGLRRLERLLTEKPCPAMPGSAVTPTTDPAQLG
ncbi:MAG: sigma-70 family RNA polymerase sigma factor [Micromonosporaceae bacterium]|nr:sigma-70 family RNA polymerase sigma factor [Micromonosporaceae bacterium]